MELPADNDCPRVLEYRLALICSDAILPYIILVLHENRIVHEVCDECYILAG